MLGACGSVPAGGRPRLCCVLDIARYWRTSSRRIGLVVLVLAAVAGCSGPTRTGATLDSLKNTVGAPRAGQARIIVLRDKAFSGIIDAGWQVYLDGTQMGDLKTGTFIYADRAAGKHQLTFSRAGDLARASHQEFVASSGRTHFFRLDMNDKGRMVYGVGVTAGLAGMFISSVAADAADQRGFFDFTPLDDATAQQAIAELRLAE
jgi:hypothetical protein